MKNLIKTTIIVLVSWVPLAWSAESRDAHIKQLQEQLDAANHRLEDRSKEISGEMKAIDAALKDLEPLGGVPPAPDEVRKRNQYIAQRSMLQNELTFLQSAVAARQSSVDAQENELWQLQELDLFNKRLTAKKIYYGPAQAAAIKAKLDQAHTIMATIEQSNIGRQQRLKVLQDLLDQRSPGQNVNLLLAEQSALVASTDSANENRQTFQAKIQLLEAQLKHISPSSAATSRLATATGPANDRKDAENKQKLAEIMQAEARGGLYEARRQLKSIREQIEASFEKGEDTSKLEYDQEFWEHKFDYEFRGLRQAELEKRIAMEKRVIAQLQLDIDAARGAKDDVENTIAHYSDKDRQRLSEEYRNKADAAGKLAADAERRFNSERPAGDLWEVLLKSIDAQEDALRERLERDYNIEHYLDHHDRMRHMLDTERQQINVLQNSWEVISLCLLRQATLNRTLADVQTQIANILLPPAPGFLDRNRTVINSIWVVVIAAAAMYAVKLLIWLGQRIARTVGARMPGRFSVKRVETVLSFFSSIAQVFIWIFAVILVLAEFNFDPAKSTAIIGLISLVLAGMFQQIVIDFVKGFDIITGRHYNVGDFVELDGKTGYVIDFSVKHTRIRSASGQEYNLPNSKCIPSKRFPDGYLDNYVDIAIRSTAMLQRAKRAIAPVCRHLSRRIEQVKDEPIFVDQFPGTRANSLILRYRVRVLPASDWVVREQFIPDVKAALAEEGIELVEEPTFFFINRIQTFRQLFSRELTEEEILQEAKDQQRPTVDRAPEADDANKSPAEQIG